MRGEERRYLLLRGRLPSDPIFPPYFEKKSAFILCLECEGKECASACEEKVIYLHNGIPLLNFSLSGCTFCDECAKACPSGVLKVENRREKIGESFILPKKCLAWNGVVCQTCGDACPSGAIQFQGLFNPIVLESKCKGCGFCISVCPEPGAIRLFPF
jgi:ferredoxin-type protein NapF